MPAHRNNKITAGPRLGLSRRLRGPEKASDPLTASLRGRHLNQLQMVSVPVVLNVWFNPSAQEYVVWLPCLSYASSHRCELPETPSQVGDTRVVVINILKCLPVRRDRPCRSSR